MLDFLLLLTKITMAVLAVWKLWELFFKNIEKPAEILDTAIVTMILVYYLVSKESGKKKPSEEDIMKTLENQRDWGAKNQVPPEFIRNLDSALKKFKQQ